MDDDMKERLARVETTVESLAKTQERISETLDVMRETLVLNEGNRRRVDDLDDRLVALEHYLKSRWYVIVTVASAITVIVNILYRTL